MTLHSTAVINWGVWIYISFVTYSFGLTKILANLSKNYLKNRGSSLNSNVLESVSVKLHEPHNSRFAHVLITLQKKINKKKTTKKNSEDRHRIWFIRLSLLKLIKKDNWLFPVYNTYPITSPSLIITELLFFTLCYYSFLLISNFVNYKLLWFDNGLLQVWITVTLSGETNYGELSLKALFDVFWNQKFLIPKSNILLILSKKPTLKWNIFVIILRIILASNKAFCKINMELYIIV